MKETYGLHTVLRIFRSYWHIIIVLFVMFTAVGFFQIIRQPYVYSASSIILVTHRANDQKGEQGMGIITTATLNRINSTIANIAKQPTTFDLVREKTNLDISDHAMWEKIYASPIKNTDFIEITAKDQSKEGAQNLANASAEALLERHQLLELEKEAHTGTVLQILEKARKPSIPVSTPKHSKLVLLLIVAAFVSFLGGAFVYKIDKRVESEEDITDDLNSELLGSVHTYSGDTASLAVVQDTYQNISSTINLLNRKEPKYVFSVSGTRPGEGKSYTIANLAIALKDIGDRVTVVDLDLRRPALDKLFEVKNARNGIGPAILGNKSLPAAQSTQYKGIKLIPAGKINPRKAARVYESPRLKELTKLAYGSDKSKEGNSHWVLIDLPPLFATPSTVAAVAMFKNTIFVARNGLTKVREAKRVLERITMARANVLGVILVGARRSYRSPYYSYYSGSAKGLGISGNSPKKKT